MNTFLPSVLVTTGFLIKGPFINYVTQKGGGGGGGGGGISHCDDVYIKHTYGIMCDGGGGGGGGGQIPPFLRDVICGRPQSTPSKYPHKSSSSQLWCVLLRSLAETKIYSENQLSLLPAFFITCSRSGSCCDSHSGSPRLQ